MTMLEIFGLVKELWSLWKEAQEMEAIKHPKKSFPDAVEFDWEKYVIFSIGNKEDLKNIIQIFPKEGYLIARIHHNTRKHIYKILEII